MKQALWAVSALHRGHTATNCPDIAPHPEGNYADFRPRPRSRAWVPHLEQGVGLHDEPAAVREKVRRRRAMPRHRRRAALTSPGCYLGPIGSASFSSMRYSGRRGAAGSSLILATLPLKQPPLAITSESVLMLPRTWPVAAISTLPVAGTLAS